MDEAENLRNRMVSTFKRKGGDGHYVRLFDHLEPWQKDLVLTEMPLREQELPVIGGVEGQEKWFLITTQRIVWRRKDSSQSIPFDQISEASIDFNSLSRHTKLQTQELEITTQDRKRRTLLLENGFPLIGVWNVLKHIGFRNRKNADTH
ncbi:MAG TPA: hypothetical protein VFS77_08740 [Pyrinomonadaceae bacterium]|nr:hypothetical protein [Pyrinomonadaceae bacterium]